MKNGLSAGGVVAALVTGLFLSWLNIFFASGFVVGIFVGAIWVRHDVRKAIAEGRLRIVATSD